MVGEKVSAARSTIRLLASKYNNKEIDLMLFTGVAGALKSNLKQWDIVLAESLYSTIWMQGLFLKSI